MRPKREWSVILAMATVLGLGACVENRQSVTILRMGVAGSSCTISGDTEGTYIQMGRLEIVDAESKNVEYYVFPIVQNNLLSTASDLDVERNQIEIKEAHVELGMGALGSAKFSYPVFISLNPGDSAALQVVAIPAAASAALANALPNVGDTQWVRARISFLYQHGEYNRLSQEVDFPIQVGRYLLFTRPEDALSCTSEEAAALTHTGNPCNIYQDDLVDCCVSGSSLVCPALVTTTQ